MARRPTHVNYYRRGREVPEKELICVLCGTKWLHYSNRCVNPECSGFCTWGYEPMKPESFTIDTNGNWILNPPKIEDL